MKYNDLLRQYHGKRAHILGKCDYFSHDEIARFLKPYEITLTDTIEQAELIFEAKRLNPVEEMRSEEAYERGAVSLPLEALERALSQSLRADSVLMSLKLANDQARLLRLLSNEYLDDRFFLRLLHAYRWGEIDDDRKEDRDVVSFTLRRFLHVGPTETDLLTTYLSLRRLATQTTDPELLEALCTFPNYSFSVRGKRRVTLYETIAANEAIESKALQTLLSKRDRYVDIALAGNPGVGSEVLHRLFERNDTAIDKALAQNPSIDDTLFEALAKRGDTTVQGLLLLRQPVSISRLHLIEDTVKDPELFAVIGENTKLAADVLNRLIQNADELCARALAQNPTLSTEKLQQLYDRFGESIAPFMASNPNTPKPLLDQWFKLRHSDASLQVALAKNRTLSEERLDMLYREGSLEVHQALATNAGCSDMLLDQLKLDSRLQPYLAQNEKLIRSYEAVLNQQKAMMNV